MKADVPQSRNLCASDESTTYTSSDPLIGTARMSAAKGPVRLKPDTTDDSNLVL